MQINKFLIIVILLMIFSVITAFFINLNSIYKKRHIIDDGIMLWYNQPSSIYYNNALYYSYLGLDKSVIIGKRKDKNNTKKKLFTYKKLDDHGAPTIWIIQNGKEKGKILTFFSLHSSKMFFTKSKEKENIKEWENLKVFDNRKTTYNSIGETSKGKIFVFYTVESLNNRSYVYRYSLDGADTWSKPEVLINFGINEYIYSVPVLIEDENIVVSFTSYKSKGVNKGHKNIYLLRSIDGGDTWYQANDKTKIIELPLIKNKALPILYTNQNRENVVWDLKFDLNKQPYISYVEHAPFSNEGWEENKAKIISYDSSNNLKSEYISELSSFVYPAGIRINPNKISNYILGSDYKGKSKLVNFNETSNTLFDIFNKSNGHEMNPIFPLNSSGRYLIYMDVEQYFKKKYKSKIILIENGL